MELVSQTSHRHGIVHGAMKMVNIFIGDNGELGLSDFDRAIEVEDVGKTDVPFF